MRVDAVAYRTMIEAPAIFVQIAAFAVIST